MALIVSTRQLDYNCFANMGNQIERERRIPEAEIAIGLSMSQVYKPLTVVQGIMTRAILEQTRDVPLDDLRWGVLGVLAAATAIGWYVETRAIGERGYSSNPATTLAYALVRNKWLAVALGTTYSYVASISNPVDVASVAGSIITRDGGRLVMANLLAKTAIGFSFTVTTNLAVRYGVVEPAVVWTQSVIDQMIVSVDKFFAKSGIDALDAWLVAPYLEWAGGDSHAGMKHKMPSPQALRDEMLAKGFFLR